MAQDCLCPACGRPGVALGWDARRRTIYHCGTIACNVIEYDRDLIRLRGGVEAVPAAPSRRRVRTGLRPIRKTDPPRDLLGEPNSSASRLTAREREVALLVADGKDNAEIARHLGISASRVSDLTRRARWRLYLVTRDDLAAWVRARAVPGLPEGRALWRVDSEEQAAMGPMVRVRDSDYDHLSPAEIASSEPSRRRLALTEYTVAQFVADGLGPAAIADRMGLATATAYVHIAAVKGRLGLSTRAEIAAWVLARRRPDNPQGRLWRSEDVQAG
jgi:DNA-binding CsgD family transcriptional regulator